MQSTATLTQQLQPMTTNDALTAREVPNMVTFPTISSLSHTLYPAGSAGSPRRHQHSLLRVLAAHSSVGSILGLFNQRRRTQPGGRFTQVVRRRPPGRLVAGEQGFVYILSLFLMHCNILGCPGQLIPVHPASRTPCLLSKHPVVPCAVQWLPA